MPRRAIHRRVPYLNHCRWHGARGGVPVSALTERAQYRHLMAAQR